jgi:hypothetical protein
MAAEQPTATLGVQEEFEEVIRCQDALRVTIIHLDIK